MRVREVEKKRHVQLGIETTEKCVVDNECKVH